MTIDVIEAAPHYADHVLPPRDVLWDIVREARDYLGVWVSDRSSRVHPTKGNVYFNSHSWGISCPVEDKPGCMVCLAGLWYVHRFDRLLGEERATQGVSLIPRIADFLDALRFPYTQTNYIKEKLGIPYENIMRTYGYQGDISNVWDPDSPNYILDFLSWLLEQKDKHHDNN